VLSIFASNAIGAGRPELAGIWLQVSLVVLLVILLPTMALWVLTGPVLTLFIDDAALVADAAYYAIVLVICLPARVAFSQLSQYFAALQIVRPFALAGMAALLANLLLGLLFVLHLRLGAR
jgi:Na+-driven multidrug efflux pump